MVASICLFVFVCELLEKIMSALNIQTVPKKVNKTNADIIKVKEDLKKQIVTIPYSLV